jgi:2-polyprenyl-3-methyl-5-hydroxy-6-metoxy-1,4-benzoquinol methylase
MGDGNEDANCEEVRMKESEFIDEVSHTYTCDGPLSQVMRRLTLRTFAPWMNGGRALEMGCADGVLTELISQQVDHLDVVDGAREFLKKAQQRELANVRFIYSLFEEFEPDQQYDYAFVTFVLEHVQSPVAILERVRVALKPQGRLFVVVPNARALSRQLARRMGLLRELAELTPNDRDHGHRRVYDRESLNRDLQAAGFEPVSQGGLFLKLLADFQMDELIHRKILRQDHFEGLYQLGLEYPDLCGALFAVCIPKL